ncbi:hypothetical protein [Archangium sp.]|uniref:hypothetical protein n=1 Tax=Archangium sp. TaxID=1872627 RepID=UPI0038D3C09B
MGRVKAQSTPVLLIIEEAHAFLSANWISRMPVLLERVARIARRGRKRWLGLVFVTQLPHSTVAVDSAPVQRLLVE